eukprot:CAMPEP_0204572652 /NCGR_PEP_ID=MMETSP0661-20131031/39583_1 /ASSEMBLY_ACC=CAM_ASM_000606 /TAXON_ID=109239 /ORGANISM="Alexandrium margalefi, Strain AMGDE01CS-322" /LENGTH=73 /DNA_ID=CAMNT_0051581017 /DNA_START=149 /DNA_END=371 /DNA_ORIENTATION=+
MGSNVLMQVSAQASRAKSAQIPELDGKTARHVTKALAKLDCMAEQWLGCLLDMPLRAAIGRTAARAAVQCEEV